MLREAFKYPILLLQITKRGIKLKGDGSIFFKFLSFIILDSCQLVGPVAPGCAAAACASYAGRAVHPVGS